MRVFCGKIFIMKKILFTLIAALLLNNAVIAQENVSFLYINGSNNNDEKMKNWFEKGVIKLHPVMKKNFEKYSYEYFLQNGEVSINEEPSIFFWGDKSKRDLEFVENQLDISKAFSPTIAYKVRSMIAGFLHDAIWVQKNHHMMQVVDELNETIKSELKNGNKVVLFGYSAGSFITYEYLFNRAPYLNLAKLSDVLALNDDIKSFIKENPVKDTCIAALSDAKIGTVSSAGHLIFDNNNTFKEKYINLDSSTDKVCMPEGAVKGIINFASPLVLFYSDISDPDYELTYYNRYLLKYILEKDLFMLTINFKEDPMGYPTSKNLSLDELKETAKIDINDPKGFVYDNSGVWSKRTFLLAHTSYWSARKTFAKAAAKSYAQGYNYFYNIKESDKL